MWAEIKIDDLIPAFILVTRSHTCFFRTVLYKMKTVLDFLKKKRENEILPNQL